MIKSQTNLRQRVNITLPRSTLLTIDRVVRKGSRSGFIDRAIRLYIKEINKFVSGEINKFVSGRLKINKFVSGEIKAKKFKTLLREGAMERAPRDLSIADELFLIEDDYEKKEK